jgi:hypothetical protein
MRGRKEMELTVKERLILQSMLPKEANFTTLKLMRKLREALSFDEEEHKKLQFVQQGERLQWNMEAEQNLLKDVQIGDMMNEMIVSELKKMDKDGKLTEDHLSLYEKFVENN